MSFEDRVSEVVRGILSDSTQLPAEFISSLPQIVAQNPVPGSAIGKELDYVQITTNYTNATTGFTSIIDGSPISFGVSTRIKIEFFSPLVELSGAGVSGIIELFDGSTDLCELAGITSNSGTGVVDRPAKSEMFLTASAGTHTYHIKARMLTAGSILVAAGTGSGATTAPAWYRVTRA